MRSARVGRGRPCLGWGGPRARLSPVQERIRFVELAPSPLERGRAENERRALQARRVARGAWLIPLLALAAIVAAFALVQHGPERLFAYALGALFALGFLWIAISVFWPARAERGCPACKRESVRRLDPRTTMGLVCGACGWRDENASSWFLAEEEGPLEELVLRQRAARRGARTAEHAREGP